VQLRSQLLDAAISAAKEYGHSAVEPRHVHFAIARRFKDKVEAQQLYDRARANLEPYGSAAKVGEPTPEVAELLAKIASDQDAVKALVEALGTRTDGPTDRRTDGRAGQATAGAEAKPNPEASTAAAPEGPKKEETVAGILAELDALVGLAPVKAQVRNVIAVVEANAQRVKNGLKPVNPSLHLVFTGPPGTGKTTVARIIARLYAAAGALPGAGFTECSRPDLIAGYVGQTAIKTMEVIRRTRPGVMFIDEAYALTPRSEVDFGSEAIATIVKAMEDHRDELAVIVAGYGEEMTGFVESNPGLRSRFKTYIAFPDYDADELTRIFELFAKEAEILLGEGVLDKAREVFAAAVDKPAFGNARFVRSLFEMAYARMAARAAADGRVSISELRQILPQDIATDVEDLQRETRRIGFGRTSK
jgi:stage V sporulation protein K